MANIRKFPKTLLLYRDDDMLLIGSENNDPNDLTENVKDGQKVARYELLVVETFHSNPSLVKEDDGD